MYSAVSAVFHGVYKNAILLTNPEEFLAQPTMIRAFSAEGFALQCYSFSLQWSTEL